MPVDEQPVTAAAEAALEIEAWRSTCQSAMEVLAAELRLSGVGDWVDAL